MKLLFNKLLGILGLLFRVFYGIFFISLIFITVLSISYIFCLIISIFLLSAFEKSILIKNHFFIYLFSDLIKIEYFLQTSLVFLLSKELFFLSKIVQNIYQQFIFRTLELYFLHYDNVYFNRKWFNIFSYSSKGFKHKQLKYKSNSVDFFLRKVFNLDFQRYEYKRRVYGLLKGRRIRRTISVKRYFFDIFGGNTRIDSNIRVTNRTVVQTLKKKKDRQSVLELYIGYFQNKRPMMVKIAGDWFTSPRTMTVDKQLAWYYLSIVGTTPFKLLVNSLLFYDIPLILRSSFIIFVFIIFIFKFIFSFFLSSIIILTKLCSFFFFFNLICIQLLLYYGIFLVIDVSLYIFFLGFLNWMNRDVWLYLFKNWFFLLNFQLNTVLIFFKYQTFIFLSSYAFDKIKVIDFNKILQYNAKKHYIFGNLFQNYKYYKKFKNKRDLTYKEIITSPWRRLKARQRKKRGLRYMDYFKNINNILNRLVQLDYFKYNKGITRTSSWRRKSFLRVGFERVFKNKNFRDFLEPFIVSRILQNFLRTSYLYSLQYRISMNFFYFKELDLKLKIDPLNLFYFFALIEFMFKKSVYIWQSRCTAIVSVTFYFEAIYRLYFAYISFFYNLQMVEFIKPTALIYEKFIHEPFLLTHVINEQSFNAGLKNLLQSNFLSYTEEFNVKNHIFFIFLANSFLQEEFNVKNSVDLQSVVFFLVYFISKHKK